MTIWGANINPNISQCKNCWWWGHATMSCCIQGSKYVKYNSPHRTENHCQFGWCCKMNEKTNLSHLETKKAKSCPYSFKCFNYRGDYQANSNLCPFWKHRFYRKWHIKEYNKICENRSNSIHSTVNDTIQWFVTS